MEKMIFYDTEIYEIYSISDTQTFGAVKAITAVHKDPLVVSFDAPMQQALAVDVINAPYQLRFFATDAAVAPTDLASWGPELGTLSLIHI